MLHKKSEHFQQKKNWNLFNLRLEYYDAIYFYPLRVFNNPMYIREQIGITFPWYDEECCTMESLILYSNLLSENCYKKATTNLTSWTQQLLTPSMNYANLCDFYQLYIRFAILTSLRRIEAVFFDSSISLINKPFLTQFSLGIIFKNYIAKKSEIN